MATTTEVAGSYVGTPRLRPGAENSLKPAEVRALLREVQATPLELRPDGTFRHRSAVEGCYTVEGSRVRCAPASFDGMSHETMRRRAEDAGREFGLAWLFDPFDLDLEEDGTMATVSSSVVQVAYARKGAKK